MVYRQRIIFPVYLCTDRPQINSFIANTHKKNVIPFFYSIFFLSLSDRYKHNLKKDGTNSVKARNPKIGHWLFAIGIVACMLSVS